MLPPEHPNAFAIHQRREQKWSSASALADTEDVDVMFLKSLADQIEMQIPRDDMVVIEQKNELRLSSVNCGVPSNANTHIVILEINHMAMPCSLRVLH